MKYSRQIPLQHKILFGYIILVAIITSMVAVLFHERNRVEAIETEAVAIRQIRRDGNTILHQISVLAFHGETALSWTEEDLAEYRELRLRTDSMLRAIHNAEFVRQGHIDTLRGLLASKEAHLYQIMRLSRQQDSTDDLLLKRLPAAVRQATRLRTVTRKKKGVPGWFGAKETVHLPPDTVTLHSLNRELLSIQEERQKDIDSYADSLRGHNKELNRELLTLITRMDGQFQSALDTREERLKISYDRSTSIITSLVLSAVFLLFISYLVIHRDIRMRGKDRKRLEETIEQNTTLLEMRKNIILTISHDIRAPLNIISGSAELAMDTREKKRRNTHLDNIRIVCKHVVHLLNNLLDVYRLNEAKETRNDVPFNLNGLLERIASGFSHVVTNKGILFRQDFKDTDVNLYGDVDRIEQIMDNLLTNAVKFTESGTITLSACYHEGILMLEVKDSGIGMSPETLSRIFRPFERLTSATNVDGVGLGLSITKGIVRLLGGEIDVTSNVGQGTTFRVTLPLSITDEPVESENKMLPHPEHLPRNVLVIDDDTMFLDVIKEMLERNGITCTLCSSAKEIVKAIRGKDYDLLLSDILMPGTSGFDLLDLLRNSNVGNSREIPVIAMTARGDREKEAFFRAGFTDCIYKPFSSSELLSLLSTIKTDRKEEKHKTDFSMILAEVSDKPKTLRSFISQLKKDREELDVAMKHGDRQRLHEIIHRMQPMWELLQTEDVLPGLRPLLRKDDSNDSELNSHIQNVIDTASVLITEAEDEIKRLTNETEDINS
ncbi:MULTISPECIES: hybrid sensor histidine kinase/response regulator [Bacteroides]|nr:MULTISPECIES: hybrid sensor histidine kinase/response regulator [Bacteroides]MBU8972723.1 response regulator [Bacteroides eggerthii]MBU8997649.1 response regulator [Bacteroides eggerthii]MBV4218745.1 response regulator [Bacteroides uniformis]MBV4232634.1 response regulator [Bacteroides uniformis]MCB7406302.1 response regulator [Bacteroides uniformis]